MVAGEASPHAPSRGSLDSRAKLLISTANLQAGKLYSGLDSDGIPHEGVWEKLKAQIRALMANSHIVVLTEVSYYWWTQIVVDVFRNASTVLKRGDWGNIHDGHSVGMLWVKETVQSKQQKELFWMWPDSNNKKLHWRKAIRELFCVGRDREYVWISQ